MIECVVVHLTLCSFHVTYTLQIKSTLYICLNVKEILSRKRRHIWSLSDCNGTRFHNHSLRKRTTILPNWPNHWAVLWVLCLSFNFVFLSFHVRISEWICTLYFPEWQDFEELLARNKPDIWSLCYCNGISSQSQLVCKHTRNYLAKLAKWFCSVLSTYLYSALDCMSFSCHVRIPVWLYSIFDSV